jgi:hypothetical protein
MVPLPSVRLMIDSVKAWWNSMENDQYYQPKPKQRLVYAMAVNAVALSFVYFISHSKKLEKLLPTNTD